MKIEYGIIVGSGEIIYPSPTEEKRLYRRMIAILKQNDGRYTIKAGKESHKRSNQQNAYYWGVVLPCITDEFKRLGNNCNTDLVHEYLKTKFGKKVIVNFESRGEKILLSTSKYSKQDFIDYLEQVLQFAAQTLEIEIPEPQKTKL